jgi:hypothetical protein
MEDKGSIVDFLAAWAALADNPGADINDRVQVPYIAVGVKASKNGVLDCGFKLPECLENSSVFISPVTHGEKLGVENRNDRPLFHSIMTIAGNITDIHDDSAISTSMLANLYGIKILLSWPGSRTNRKYFRNCYGTTHDLRVLDAIKKMPEGFKVTILRPGIGVTLDPGMIHAVISPTNSAIGCWEYVDAQWLDSDDILEGGLWELEMLKERASGELPIDEKTKEMYRQLNYGLSMWKCLKENLIQDGGVEMRDKVEQIERLVTRLESEFPDKEILKPCPAGKDRGTKRRRTA